MSNEHPSQVGQSAVDDEGPLDPSVFFGLFDDLVDDGDDEEAANDEAGLGEAANGEAVRSEAANGEAPNGEAETSEAPNGDAETSEAPDGDAETSEAEQEITVDHGADHDELHPDPSEPDTATVSWWSTAPQEESSNGRTENGRTENGRTENGRTENGRAETVASPPPIPPGAERSDAVLSVDTLEPARRGVTDGGPAGNAPPKVTFTPIDTDHPSNGVRAETAGFAAPTVDRIVTRQPGVTGGMPQPQAIEPGDGGGTVAKATLVTIAVGLFAGLVVAFAFSLSRPDSALEDSAAGDPAGSTVTDETPTGIAGSIATGTRPTAELLAGEFATALQSTIADRVDLTSLRFEPGTTELDERSTAVVAELGALLVDQPTVPVTIAVRTYTESTPADNLALSVNQAEALAGSLVAAGASPEQIRAQGLGAAPLSRAQPVPNFVALTPRFGDRRFDEVLRRHSPFAFGVPATAGDGAWALRPDGLLAIGELADTLSVFPDAEIGAAGYSFLAPSEAGIRSEADTAAVELAEFLVAAYGVDSGQITTIIPGAAVFVPTPEHGNHIWLQIGPGSQGAFDVASIDPDSITFEPGSADLDVAGLSAVRSLADVLTTGGSTIVVDVRSYESIDADGDQALSEARRDSLTEALISAGVAPEQLRMYASGASSYLLDDGGSAITITVAP